MIKFFRHIRKSLIQENKMGKYFKYAIGEIILVVIGILIALQINNWNEDQKILKRENFYLDSLLDDMRSNLLEIQEDINGNYQIIKSCDSLLLLANEGTYAKLNDERIGNLIISLGEYSKLQLEQGTIEEIIYSGSLQTIQNESIRGFVVDWERDFIEIKEMEKFARQFQEKYFSILDTFLPYYKFDFVEKKYTDEVRDIYFSHMELLNTVGNIRFVAKRLINNYKEKLDEINVFITNIKNELDQ
ncbi:DUF6090 family protein [Winogradskyella sp. A2]|uniref:DUF6090 family protein n=1 Tax=Winogradskyella sp. A2 TaxID=3366944 RepID=UPI00398C3340